MNCYKCNVSGKVKELRPYGPRGESICFKCAMEPDSKATTEMMFGKTLDACGDLAVLDGSQVRPATATEREELAKAQESKR